ncbi:cellulose biosynthesis protein BcsE [Paraburkholderia elongata]|uniref:Cellulose biosynthesis protein BcsE n=1 Tax=Paraburkholderia elongata TaxID=2675747 RepID=A0A972NUW4_9BURK|nr:cellulose biosynthesis protein BcsE [Paraburkholderia elongata]NPT60258.1 cellulose biosynthesis protein BcsE [Paraburkholderia elongata]
MSTVSKSLKPTSVGAFVRRLLQAVRRAGSDRGARPVGQLAIDALPDEWAALEAGKLYAIYAAARTPGADALLWESARQAQARDVTVVLARPRAQVATRLRELGFSARTPASGWPRNLSVLAMPPAGSASAGPAAAGAHGVPPVALAGVFGGLRALKRFGFRSRSLYFVEGAERWFNWEDPAALAREGRMLANWCAVRNITLVLLLGSPSDADADVAADSLFVEPAFNSAAAQHGRNEFHAACAGVARMERTHGELLWHVDFWRSDRTLVTGDVRSLRFTDGGRLSVAPDALGNGAARGDGLLARDEQRVVVSRAVVRGDEAWVPPNWEVLADQKAVLAACVDAQAATVVLDYAGGAQLDALCAAIHALRRQAGRALKIVVAERGEVLRHQYELLVLTLGANLVLGRDLPFSRMQSLLQSLQGQLHTRPIAADYRSALSAALSEDVLGYLPAGAFCERVRAVLERSVVLQLPHVLVKLTLLPQCAHLEALRSCVPRRAGDVFTADASHLYVFLFACRLADADAALARIFNVPVERIAGDIVHLAEQSIGDELNALATASRRTPIADYSGLFATPLRNHTAAPATAAHAGAVLPAGEGMSTVAQLAAVEQALGAARAEAAQASGQKAGQVARYEAGHEAGQAEASGPIAPQPLQPPAPRMAPPQRRAEPHAMPLRKKGSE